MYIPNTAQAAQSLVAPTTTPLARTSSDYPVSRSHARFVMAVLFILMLFDYIDRSIVNSMFPYIKKEWSLSDTQLGALASVVSLAVGVLSLPVALLVDRWSRVKSIVLMGTCWSLATVGCMAAGNYGQMLALRGAIGAGEAGYGNAGSALLAYHFPARLRSTVIGLFYFACSAGSLLGIIAGGFIAAKWGWKAAFGIVGVPGLLVSLLVFFVKDYATVPLPAAKQASSSARHVAREMFRSRSSLMIYLGSGLALIAYMAMGAWLPSFFSRIYGLQGAAAGLKTAPVILATALGTALWAVMADRMALRRPRARLQVTVWCGIATSAILFPSFMWMTPGPQQYLLILIGAFMMGSVGGITTAVAMDVAHPGLRSTAASMVTLANNLIGFTLGPFIVGMLSDRIGLQGALAWVTLFALPAAACLYRASLSYEDDKARIDKLEFTAGAA